MLQVGLGLCSLPVQGGGPSGPALDTTAPLLVSAVIDVTGLTLTLTYDEALDETSEPAPSDYNLNGTASEVDAVNVTGSTVALGLDTAVFSNEPVTLDFTQPGTTNVQDLAGNDAANLTAEPVINGSNVPFTPLGAATWSTDGIYFDARDVAYDGVALQGDALVTTLTPRHAVSGVLTPNGSPTWDVTTIGGRRTLKFLGASSQALNFHQLAALMNGADLPLTVVMRVQQDVAGTKVLWGFGNSVQGSKDFCEGFTAGVNASMSCRLSDDALVATSFSAGNTLTFIPRVIAWVFTGTSVSQYYDVAGVMTLMSGTRDYTALGNIVVNQVRFGATARNSYGFPSDCHLQCLAMTSQVLTQAQLQTIYNSWIADDAPAGAGTKIAWYGDSITRGSQDSGEGGFRRYAWNDCVANSKSVDFVGSLTNGTFAEAQHSGYSSFEINSINGRITTELGTGKLFAPKYTVVMAGTNNIDNGGSAVADAITDIQTLLNNLHTRATQTDATHRIILATIPDRSGFTSEVNTYNAALPGIVSTFNLANPSNQIILWDANAALGPYSGTWGADGTHPNSTGYAILGHDLYTSVLASLL